MPDPIKPPNCTCQFPRLIARNMCGHGTDPQGRDCPILTEFYRKLEAERAKLEEGKPPIRPPDTSPERLTEIRAAQAMVRPTSLGETTFAVVGDLLAMIDELEATDA